MTPPLALTVTSAWCRYFSTVSTTDASADRPQNRARWSSRASTCARRAGVMSTCRPVTAVFIVAAAPGDLKYAFAFVRRRNAQPPSVLGHGPARDGDLFRRQPLHQRVVRQGIARVLARDQLADALAHRHRRQVFPGAVDATDSAVKEKLEL